MPSGELQRGAVSVADPGAPEASPAPAGPGAPAHDESLLLRAFLRGRDVPCPRCDYNLRDHPGVLCPECGERLDLRVGIRRTRFALLVLALTPGLFSGVAAALLLLPLTLVGGAPPPVWYAELFGLASVSAAVCLYLRRDGFLRMSARRQGAGAALVWAIHVGAFGLLILAMR